MSRNLHLVQSDFEELEKKSYPVSHFVISHLNVIQWMNTHLK